MIGEKLDRYHLLDEAGTGSMGTVYRAEDQSTGQIVAVKLVTSKVLYDPSRRERFLQGVLLASQVRHPNVCPILEIGDDEDDLFIVMPYLQGETLAHLMKRRSLPWQETIRLGISVAQGLSAVHSAGAVHRSLKPSNIWIRRDGSVLLTDCCVARFTELDCTADATATRKPEFADTIIPMSALAYMSPEQVRGEAVDHRCDLFALGAILYELLSDRHPFEARNSLSRISAILESNPARLTSRKQVLPAALDGALRKAMDRRPESRYHDAQEMGSALSDVLARGTKQESVASFLQAGKAHSTFWKILGFCSVLVIVVISILYLFLSR